MKRRILFYAAMLFVSLTLAAAKPKPTTEPILTNEPLTPERVAIYRDFLATYAADPANVDGPVLNVVMVTEPFTPSRNMDPDKPCLWADDIDNLTTPQLHKFSPDASPSARIRFVDLREPEPVRTSHSLSVPFVHRKSAAAPPPSPPPSGPPPATRITLSEIVFNKAHTLAAFHYSVRCGDECGHGDTVLYELHSGAWRPAKSGCSKWVI
jgi:hypothetical protein